MVVTKHMIVIKIYYHSNVLTIIGEIIDKFIRDDIYSSSTSYPNVFVIFKNDDENDNFTFL